MSNPPPKPPPSPLAASWLQRLHLLQLLRQQCASAPQHFRWLIQTRILQFLLKCYGSDPNLTQSTPAATPKEPLFHPLNSGPHLPRSPYVMHYYLDRIAQGNTDVHRARQQKIAEEKLTPLTLPEKLLIFLNTPIHRIHFIHKSAPNPGQVQNQDRR